MLGKFSLLFPVIDYGINALSWQIITVSVRNWLNLYPTSDSVAFYLSNKKLLNYKLRQETTY